MALIKIERVRFATDESMAYITRTTSSEFREALSELLQQVAAGIIANDPTLIAAAEAAVNEALNSSPRIPELGDERQLRVLDRAGAVAFSINAEGKAFIGDGADSGRTAFRVLDQAGAVAFEVTAGGQVNAYGLTGGGGAGGDGYQITRVRCVIIFGQSLPSGRALPLLPDYDQPRANLYEVGHKTRTLRIATSPLDMQDDPDGLSPGWVYGVQAAKDAAPNEVVVLFPAAMGGTGLVYQGSDRGCWDPDYSGPNRRLFAEMLTQITDGISIIAAKWPGAAISWEAALCGLGETDSVNGVSQAAWAAKFDLLIDRLWAHLGVQVPIILGQSVREWMDTVPNSTNIQRAQIDTLARRPRTAFAYMPPNAGNYGDVLHANRKAIETLGARLYAAVEEANANADGNAPLAPQEIHAWVEGTTLRIEWDRPLCRATDYTVEYRIGSGSWTTISRSSPLHREASVSGIAAGVVQVRVTTVNGSQTSFASEPVYASRS